MEHAAQFNPRRLGDGALSAPIVKGWCPTAYRPMMSGDGLLVRVKPKMGRLTATQGTALCAASERFGNGVIDLTNRANLQIRGVSEEDHLGLLDALASQGLIDHDAALEQRRAVLTTPLWSDGDLSSRVYAALMARLSDFPELPTKMGIAVDCGQNPILQDMSADFRFEQSANGALILRADGADAGRVVSVSQAANALLDMMAWFLDTGGRDNARMARHLRRTHLPKGWADVPPVDACASLTIGPMTRGFVYGVPFGAIAATELAKLLRESGAPALRVTPWRRFILEGTSVMIPDTPFLTSPDPVERANACPGAPACAQGLQSTHDIARRLAKGIASDLSLHVSGCAKGCARRSAADLTLVGTKNGYDLVREGRAWDEPERRALPADAITKDSVG